MSDIEAQYFVQSFVRFLNQQIEERNFSSDILESLEVAGQCLETAYNLPIVSNNAATADGSSTGGTSTNASTDTHPMSHIDLYELFQNACNVLPDRKLEAENIKNEGNCLMREEKYHEALKAYNRAICLDPTNPVFYCNRAATHSRLGDYQRAADDCKLSLRYDPNYGKAYGRLGVAYSKLNKHDMAVKAYKSALELEPNNADYLNNMNVAQQRLTESLTTGAAPNVPSATAPGTGPFNAGAFQLPLDPGLLGSLSTIINQPGVRETFTQFMQDPALQGLVRTMTNASPDLLSSLAQMQSQMENGGMYDIFQMNESQQQPQNPPGNNNSGGDHSAQQPPPQP